MMPETTTDRLVYARRFSSRCLVPRDHPNPERVRAHMDEITTTELRDALRATLYQYLDPTSNEIWCIRRLELDVSVNAAWDRDRLARVWASQVARSLATVIESNGDDADVVRFEDRTAYIAQFISDLIDECAWARWYYRSFEGLKLLPVPAAIRTVVCQHADIGINALARLAPEKLSRAVSMFSLNDARIVLGAMPFASVSVNMRVLLETAWRAFEAVPALAEYVDEDRVALRVCLEVARTEPAHLDRSLHTAARAIWRLIRVAHQKPEVLTTIRQILDAGSSTPLYVVVSPADASGLGPLVEGSAEWLDTVFKVVASRASGRVTSHPVVEGTVRHTSFGGALVLLPILSEIPLEEATKDWPSCGETSAVAMTRFLVLTKCLGGTSLPRMMVDQVIRDLLCIDPHTKMSDLVTWYAECDRQRLVTFAKVITKWMRERFGITYRSNTTKDGSQDGLRGGPQDSSRGGLQDGSLDGSQDSSQRRLTRQQYLAFTAPIEESFTASRAFGLAAYATMTLFARKLPGFSQSSFPHLRANFLECAATVEEQPTRRVVQLTKPPLDLILNMTGLSRATYRLPWLDTRPIALFPHGGG